MKTKKYTADTMVEAMKKVRADFGDEAIILSSTATKSKGFLGLFQKKSVEVVAGYDEPMHSAPVKISPAPPFEHEDKAAQELNKEMNEMKKMLKSLQQTSSHPPFLEGFKPVLEHLEQQGLAKSFIDEVSGELVQRMKKEKKDFTAAEQVDLVKEYLTGKLDQVPFGGITFTKKYINVLGPTGVGKTTTIAKIAARALLEHKKKIGFITTDTYRIAAIEQLRTYANLLQAPVEIAYSQDDFQAALSKLNDRDLLFIDTAGRNYKESKFVVDLQQLIDFSLEMESFLVLSATSKEEDMRDIIDQFSAFPIEKFIFTKVDETSSVGSMINVMLDYKIGAAYITDGQEVPEDMMEADSQKIISLLLKGAPNA